MEPVISEKKAALIWISRDKEFVPEMLELCSSAGYEVVVEIGQGKNVPDPKFYLGPGKIEEVGSLESTIKNGAFNNSHENRGV